MIVVLQYTASSVLRPAGLLNSAISLMLRSLNVYLFYIAKSNSKR